MPGARRPPGDRLEVADCGDSALRVVAVASDPEARWSAIQRLAAAVNASPPPGVWSAVATYDSALIEFDPGVVDHAEVAAAVSALFPGGTAATASAPTVFTVPVVYGGAYGPDLEDVARHLGLSVEQVVDAHAGLAHPVRCFSHGAAPMLDGPGWNGQVPRLSEPRVRVPRGAILVAGRQAMILSREQPSGWRVLGRTPIGLVDPSQANPVAYRPGDLFQYRRIAPDEWADHADAFLADFRA
ncbi:carboxyltransferase domain-containing protein [Spirillospora sp. NPDC047418]